MLFAVELLPCRNPATPGTSPDTYAIQVRATDVATGTLTAESDIQFVVEQAPQ